MTGNVFPWGFSYSFPWLNKRDTTFVALENLWIFNEILLFSKFASFSFSLAEGKNPHICFLANHILKHIGFVNNLFWVFATSYFVFIILSKLCQQCRAPVLQPCLFINFQFVNILKISVSVNSCTAWQSEQFLEAFVVQLQLHHFIS